MRTGAIVREEKISLPLAVWQQVLSIAYSHGWRPDLDSAQPFDSAISGRDCPDLQPTDAMGLADALELALRAIPEDAVIDLNGPLPDEVHLWTHHAPGARTGGVALTREREVYPADAREAWGPVLEQVVEHCRVDGFIIHKDDVCHCD